MIRITLSALAAGSLALTGLATFAAPASAKQVWVSGQGSNAGACTFQSPCRTIQYALTHAAVAGDEINILDSADYGRVLIRISVSIVAPPGVEAVINADGADGITVQGNDIVVTLAGLRVNTSNNANGVVFAAGARLFLDRMEIDGSGSGNAVQHNAPNGLLSMANSVVRGASYGFIAQAASSGVPARATIVNSRAEGCYYGFVAHANSFVTIAHSSAAGGAPNNGTCYGNFLAVGSGTGSGNLGVDDIVATNCAYGVASGPFGGGSNTVTVSNSVISNNGTGAGYFGTSHIVSYGNNRIFENQSGSYFSSTATTQ